MKLLTKKKQEELVDDLTYIKHELLVSESSPHKENIKRMDNVYAILKRHIKEYKI